MDFTKQISQLIEFQFPGLYKTDGQTLIALIEAYYEFLETDDTSAYKLGRQMFDIADIDTTLDSFLKHFKKMYLEGIPYSTVTDKRFMIKHITEFYHSKGSERGLLLLMKLLFGDDAQVYYPGQDVLRASDSTWYTPRYLEVTVTPRTTSMLNKQVTGATSGAKAFVESIVRKRIYGKMFDVLYLSAVEGAFIANERVTDDGIFDGAPMIKGSLSSVSIILGGRNNKVGDIFDVITTEGLHGKVKVTAVIDATGRVDFDIVDGGWGYTADDDTSIYVADAMLFVGNANISFLSYETVYQPLENLSLISGTGVLTTAIPGAYVVGMNGVTVVANGIVTAVANTNANGIVLSASANGNMTVETTVGTFGDQRNLILNSNSIVYQVNEFIDEESTVNLTYTSLTGNTAFTNTEVIDQIAYDTYGIVATMVSGTVVSGNTTLILDTEQVIIPGQTLTQTSGTGTLTANVVVAQVLSPVSIVLAKAPTGSGTVGFNINTFSTRIQYAKGKVVSSNSTVVVVSDAFGTWDASANAASLIGHTSNGHATVASVQITSQGARGQVTSVAANTVSVVIVYGTFDTGNLVQGGKTNKQYTINSSTVTGVTSIYLNGNSSANAVLFSSNAATVSGMLIGQNTSAIGLYGNNATFVYSNAYTTHVYTRRQDMISPPRYANNVIINLIAPINRIAGGYSADFKIGAISDVQSAVTLYTDIVGANNVANIPFLDVLLTGAGSGVGYVTDVTINSAGTGYSNGNTITFTGGGFANGDPIVSANATITTNGSGAITVVTVTVNGEGYFTAPTLTLPATAGTVANVSPVVAYGYGFDANPLGGYSNMLRDVLSYKISDLGSIAVLTRINPGAEYTVDPFVSVRNNYVAAYQRHDLLLNVDSVANGSFQVGEQITQTLGASTVVKGRVAETNISGTSGTILLERTTMDIAFLDGVKLVGASTGTSANLVSFISANSEPIGNNAIITGTAISANGVATSVQVIDSGYGYIDEGEVTLERAGNQFIMTASTLADTMGTGSGYWTTTTSHLNGAARIHDNKYYQTYSYEIQSGMSLNRYKNVVKRLMHVSGTELFGAVIRRSTLDLSVSAANSSIEFITIANYNLLSVEGGYLTTSNGTPITVQTED